MNKYHDVRNVKIESGFLILNVDGKEVKKKIKELSPILANASEEVLKIFEISPSGYGIHWPLLDEDISIDGILGITHKYENSKPHGKTLPSFNER